MFYAKIIILAILIGGVGFGVWHYKATMEENNRLTAEILRANDTIVKMDKKAELEEAIVKTTEEKINAIRQSPDSDDAPVAPVLDRVFDGM